MAVTALWPYGGPGIPYGSFAGKTAAPEQEVVATQARAGGGPKTRRVIVNGKHYRVNERQEYQLLQSWIEDLEEQKQDKERVLIKKRKVLKKAKKATAETERPRTLEQEKTYKSIRSIIEDIQAIETKRADAIRRVRQIQEMDDEQDALDAIHFIMQLDS